jgi:hypothetical protein
MPLTFLGFEHLPAGTNQAIYATQPLVLYMSKKTQVHISYSYDTR